MLEGNPGQATNSATMNYTLLTGATGLVGRHVLRELLMRGVPVAAMVRPGKGSTVLAGMIGRWEADAGRLLPRPVVVEGDLNLPDVVPQASDRRWLSAHCDTILHSAASMTFREDRHGEPFRTNVDGTKRLLEFCRQVGIRRFHQVSTAYLCGLRQGKILESELDVGQTLGNVYEESKLQAEKLIRAAEFIEQLTVYRPASVVGDSQTGYVTNFHGFYLPLQLAHVTAGFIPISEMNSRFFSRLGLKGNEGKNLVPVDWLSKAIAELFTNPEHHGRTYHLASEHPVSVVEMQNVIRDAIERYYPRPLATSISETELADFESKFVDYMAIYQSHWRDDPKFDVTNTRRAIPHLSCPRFTYDSLLRIARFPVERNFNAPRHEAPPVPFDANRCLATFMERDDGLQAIASCRLGMRINGPGGGDFTIGWNGERVTSLERGLPAASNVSLQLSAKTFGLIASESLSVEQAVNSGRLVAEGLNGMQPQLAEMLAQLAAGETLRRSRPAGLAT